MNTFKDFLYSIKTQLNETVPEHLRHIPDSWDHHSGVSKETQEKMNSAFGPKGFTITPLPKEEPDIDPDVAEHLTKHNWQVTDYGAGMASKKTTTTGNVAKGILPREKIIHKKIGAILDETNAPDHIKKSFTNDPSRSHSGTDNLAILHTTTPHGIADISGDDTSWANKSCMNLSSGGNRKYLEQDSKYGSSAAYLINKDDPGANSEGVPTKALARILNKPMHEDKDNTNSDTILRAEPNDWGSGGSRFVSANDRFLQEHFPAKVGVSYNLNSNLYRDKMPATYKVKTKDEIEDSVNSGKNLVDSSGDSLDKESIDHAMNHFNKNKDNLSEDVKKKFVTNMAHIGNLNSQHVSSLHKIATDSGDTDSIDTLVKNHGDKLSTNAITAYTYNHPAHKLPPKLLMNNKLPSNVIDTLPITSIPFVRKSLLNPHHIDKIIDDYIDPNGSTGGTLSQMSGKFSKVQLDRLASLDSKKGVHRGVVLNDPNFDEEQHKNLLVNATKTGSQHLVFGESKYATLKDTSPENLNYISNNKNIPKSEQLKVKDALVNDENGYVRNMPHHISNLLTSDDWDKLTKSKKTTKFDNVHHSHKHINNIFDSITKADNIISEHIANEKSKNSAYNSKSDPVVNKLKNILHSSIEKYTNAVDYHKDNHVDEDNRLDDNKNEIKFSKESLEKLHNLKNYSVASDHYNTHVKSLKADIHDLEDEYNGHTETDAK